MDHSTSVGWSVDGSVSAQTANRTRLAVFLAVLTAGAVLAAFLIITAGPATAKEFATLHPLEGTVEVQRGEPGLRRGHRGPDPLRPGR